MISTPRTILMAGGTGQTALAITKLLLQETTWHIVLATRKGSKAMTTDLLNQLSGEKITLDIVKQRVTSIKFDWFDESTFPTAFDLPLQNIYTVYIALPKKLTVFDQANRFVDYATTRGVRRFMFLSAGVTEMGGAMMGKTHAHLEKLARQSERANFVYVVLRPSWFHRTS